MTGGPNPACWLFVNKVLLALQPQPFYVLSMTIVMPQLIFDQQGFELHKSIYMQILKSKYNKCIFSSL